MPRFDGTGPRGQGPMTGRGEGHCALVLPESGQATYGYAGLQGTPVRLGVPAARPAIGPRLVRWSRPAVQRGRALRCGRGRGLGRGRGWRLPRW